MVRSFLTGAVACLFLLSVAGSAQDQKPTFRSSVRTVPIYATVADATGRLVPDLEQADFEVLDNGQPAPITIFDKEIQPIAVVIAIDASGSMTLVLDFVKMAAEAFILRLLPADRAMVMSFDDLVQTNGGFTNDRDVLIRWLRTDMRKFGNSTKLWDALYGAATLLQEETSRKAVLVLSDGQNTAGHLKGDDVLARAQDAHVMVYAIGMRNRYRDGSGWTESRPDGYLTKLTAQTGGGYFEISQNTELNSTFTRVAEELHRQYMIGITPANDGKVHKLDVRVKRPGMTARTRKSYTATVK